MIELLEDLSTWRPAKQGIRCAVATVIGVSGSAPSPVGTSMIVAAADTGISVLGSLSGGCVEGAVAAAAVEVLEDGNPRYEQFGYSADDAIAVGLTCGGRIDVHVRELPPELIHAMTSREHPVALISHLPDESEHGACSSNPGVILHNREGLMASLESMFVAAPGFAVAAAPLVDAVLVRGHSAIVRVPSAMGEERKGPGFVRLLVESRLPAPRFLIVGANDFGAALVPIAKLLGYQVTLIDARSAFASQARFAAADKIAVSWPHVYLAKEAEAGRLDERSVLCVLSHDPKFDLPLLDAALGLNLKYIGAMGSRLSNKERLTSLRQLGHQADELKRLHAPIGLDLGAVTPAEVAIAIIAEVIAGGATNATVSNLSHGTGPIHSVHDRDQGVQASFLA